MRTGRSPREPPRFLFPVRGVTSKETASTASYRFYPNPIKREQSLDRSRLDTAAATTGRSRRSFYGDYTVDRWPRYPPGFLIKLPTLAVLWHIVAHSRDEIHGIPGLYRVSVWLLGISVILDRRTFYSEIFPVS